MATRVDFDDVNTRRRWVERTEHNHRMFVNKAMGTEPSDGPPGGGAQRVPNVNVHTVQRTGQTVITGVALSVPGWEVPLADRHARAHAMGVLLRICVLLLDR